MCRKLHLSFWTPTDIKDPSLEALSKLAELNESENPFAAISRITYYECQNNPQQRLQYFRSARCPGTNEDLSTRSGPIRTFCAGDDACEVRVKGLRNAFVVAKQRLEEARVGKPRMYNQQELWEWFQKAEVALRDWRGVFEDHRGCPTRRCGDGVVCKLVNLGVMERPLELWPDRRLGENPFYEELR